MNLTTVTAARAAIEIGGQTLPTTFTALNTWLTSAVSEWSRRAVVVLDREVSTGTFTVYLDVRPGQQAFSLKAYPVTSVVSVTEDTSREFTGSTVAATNYSCQTSAGILRLDNYWPTGGPGTLKVVYRGGMAATAAAFATAYPDISGAIDSQVVYAYERKASHGRTSVSAGPGSVQYEGAMDWLPHVKQTLLSYRRVICG